MTPTAIPRGRRRISVNPSSPSKPLAARGASSGQVEIHFDWPAAYMSSFVVGVRHTSDLTQPFTDLPVSAPVNVSGDEFRYPFTPPATPQHFYYVTISLQ